MKKIKDEVAAFSILGVMVVTFVVTIGIYEYIRYNQFIEVSSNLPLAQEEDQAITYTNDFETLENVTSQEDLKKLEEENKDGEKEEEKNKNGQSDSHKYYIKVNYGAQVVNIYTKDSNGDYTVPVKAMVCSTGTHTPRSGVYSIGYRWTWLEMIGSVYGHYVTQITGDILFHSVPYLTKGDHSSLEYWAYDQLGTKASLGCVRLTTKDALWIFNNVSSGTKVEFYSSSNPGPLGKPSAMKISNAPSNIRGWDPTDPDSRNPWPKYLKELEEQEKENDKNNDNKNENNEQNNNTGTGNETGNEMGNEEIKDPEGGNNDGNENNNEENENNTNQVDDPEHDNSENTDGSGNNTDGTNQNNTNETESDDNDDNVYVSEIAS